MASYVSISQDAGDNRSLSLAHGAQSWEQLIGRPTFDLTLHGCVPDFLNHSFFLKLLPFGSWQNQVPMVSSACHLLTPLA